MKSVINRAAIELIESHKRRSRVRNEEGTATISEILSRDDKTPYMTTGGDTIRDDINKELMKACNGANVITIELEIEGKITYDPGDYWTPPEGNEEREVIDGNVLIGHGDEAKYAESLSAKAIAYLSKLFQKEVDSVKIEYSDTDYNEDR